MSIPDPNLRGDLQNETEYGCGNPRFTVQQWTLVNIPVAFTIILFFGFFQPRTRLWPGCCKGRPSVAYPVNLLDSYSDRVAFLCAFGIACIGILDLFSGNYYVEPNYDDLPEMVRGAVRSCMAYVNVFAIGLAHYPIMICLTAHRWVVSDIIGIIYTLEWGFVYYYSLAECPWERSGNNVDNLIVIPVYVCYIILFVIFAKRFYKNYTIRKKRRKGLEVELHDVEDFEKTHFYKRVRYLMTPKDQWEGNQKELTGCRKLCSRFYKDEPGFLFSRRIICTVGLSALCLYCVGILYEATSVYLEQLARDTFSTNSSLYEYYYEQNNTEAFENWKEIGETFAYTFSPTVIAAMATMICYTLVTFIVYRRNTLRLWRGDKSFCPKEDFDNTTLVVSSLKYSGYHIAFVLWGFILLQLTLWLLVFLFTYLLILPLINREVNWVWTIIKNQWLTVIVYFCVYYSQVFSAKFLFLQQRGKELSIDNRRIFHVQVYFFFFVNVIIGLASCLLRIFKSVLFGLLLVGRIDRCLLMRGFELYDSGYKAYLGFLQLEVVHTHPVVITFCHFLIKDIKEKKEKIFEFSEDDEVDIAEVPETRNKKARNKWQLAYSLINNQQLLADRLSAILEAKRAEIRRQLEEDKQKKDERIVKGAVESFVNDSESDGGIGQESSSSSKGSALGSVDEENESTNEKDGGALVLRSASFGKKRADSKNDERQVLLGNLHEQYPTTYSAILPKDNKDTRVNLEEEDETEFISTPDHKLQQDSTSSTKSWSTTSIPDSLLATPSPVSKGDVDVTSSTGQDNLEVKVADEEGQQGLSQDEKLDSLSDHSTSSEKCLVLEDEHVELPGTPTMNPALRTQ